MLGVKLQEFYNTQTSYSCPL